MDQPRNLLNELQRATGIPVISASPQMFSVFERSERVARTNACVLIHGESGSGKELVARALHCYSARANRILVDVNCGAIPENLIESELFGHERGAFSGAVNAKPGLFEMADKGTLFLDEVGELAPHLQVKLLRVLDGASYFRVGGTRKITVDVRIIAATNRDLKGLIKERLFREDLYYRLNQVSMFVPPLRERLADIRPLANFFFNQIRPGATFSEEALLELEQYPWPGNIRELRSVVTNAALATDAMEVGVESLALDCDTGPEPESSGKEARYSGSELSEVERQAVLATLRATNGHQQKAAAVLGISRRTLTRRLTQYGMVRSRNDALDAKAS